MMELPGNKLPVPFPMAEPTKQDHRSKGWPMALSFSLLKVLILFSDSHPTFVFLSFSWLTHCISAQLLVVSPNQGLCPPQWASSSKLDNSVFLEVYLSLPISQERSILFILQPHFSFGFTLQLLSLKFLQ